MSKFNPNEYLIKLKGKDYLQVMHRLIWFREEHPTWGIQTTLEHYDSERGVAIFHATITNDEGRVIAEGSKMETKAGFFDFVEKAETGSIGRALGILGYGTQFAPEFDEGERIVDSPVTPKPTVNKDTGEIVEPPITKPTSPNLNDKPIKASTIQKLKDTITFAQMTIEELDAICMERYGAPHDGITLGQAKEIGSELWRKGEERKKNA